MTDFPVLNARQALLRLGNHQPLYQRLLALFEQQTLEMQTLLENNQPLSVIGAHTLKGAAAEVGADSLREILQRAESALREQGALQPQQIAEISRELIRARQAVARYQQD